MVAKAKTLGAQTSMTDQMLDESIFEESWALLDSYEHTIVDGNASSDSNNSKKVKDEKKLKEIREKKRESAKRGRQKRKQEYEQLHLKIKKMKNEQLEFIRTIEQLEQEAKMFAVVGQDHEINTLASRNQLLRQEVMEQREFVHKIQEMMVQTKTTADDLQKHAEKMEKLRLKRKCVEICEESAIQCIGLMKHCQLEVLKGKLSSWKPMHFIAPKKQIPFHCEFIPHGSSLDTASRMNILTERIMPIDIYLMDELLLGIVRDARKNFPSYVTRERTILYEDERYIKGRTPKEPVVSLTFRSNDYGNKLTEKIVLGAMMKKMNIAESSLIANGSEDKTIECIAYIFSNVSSEFEGSLPVQAKFQIGATFLIPLANNQTRYVKVDSLPITPNIKLAWSQKSENTLEGNQKMSMAFSSLGNIDNKIQEYINNLKGVKKEEDV